MIAPIDSGGEHRDAADGGAGGAGPHDRDSGRDAKRICRSGAGAHAWATLCGDVRFDDVRFAYEPGKPVLHGISFESKPGTVTALVGSSGSGKSTIISLMCAFHTAGPGAGAGGWRGSVDGAAGQLSRQLGVVLQETFLFDGTIRENVMFSRPDATEEQLLEACRIARVDEFAERFPEGYDTIVGERGREAVGRAAAAAVDCARDSGEPADSDSG